MTPSGKPARAANAPGVGAEETAASVAETDTTPAFGPPAGPGEVGTLGPYRVVRQVGAGGMGAVYLAVDTRLNRKLALKVMLPKFAANPAAKERFLREARAAAQITHDNVVTVYEADERGGVPYIAMQFLQGYPLDEYLRKKGTPGLAQILRIAGEAAAGLAAAHAIGLVHRDIKPGNLWLEAPNGRVKVLDFGLAKPVDADIELTKSGAVVGTPAYMSPEQARGKKVDGRTDLFSLGAVLYRLCTGRLPFQGENTMAVLMALGTEEPPPVRALNPAVPEALEALVHRLLAKDPARRPQTAGEVEEAVGRLGGDVPRAVAVPDGAVPQVVYVPIQVTALPESNAFADLDATAPEPAPAPAPERRKPKPGGKAMWVVAGLASLVAAAALAGVIIIIKNKDGTETKIEVPDGATVTVKDKGGKTVAHVPPGAVPAPAGSFGLQFEPGNTVEATKVPYRKTADVTIEAWVALQPSMHPSSQMIVGVPNGYLAVLGDGLTFYTFHGGPVAAKAFNPGQRTHVAGVNDGKQRRLYVDGKLVAKVDSAGSLWPEGLAPDYQGQLRLGAKDFSGTIDQVRVSTTGRYDKDFTPPAAFEKDKDTFALYRFGEGSGDTLKDSSGNGYHAKINGAKWVTADPDRKAAEYVLSVGGTVWLNDQPVPVPNGELPAEQFTLTGVIFYTNQQVTDAGLAAFKDCKNLTHLEFWSCARVTDAGLARFSQCKGLKRLRLNGHGMTLMDAGLAAFKNCKELTHLTIAQCPSVTNAGYRNFSGCTALAELHLNQVAITDEILGVFVNCKELTTLDLSATDVADAGLANFKGCKNLTDLRLDNTQVTDAGLAVFKNCKGLIGLSFPGTKVTDAGLANFKDCKGLTNLILSDTKVTDAGLANFKDCKGLAQLYLAGTPVTDAGLANFKDCKGLVLLELSNTQTTDAGLAHFKECKGLVSLHLHNTGVTDAGLANFKDCKGLTELFVRKTKVTAKGVEEFHAAVPGCRIEHDGGVIEAKK